MPVADTLAIREFCNRKGISLLEDCSHAHGALIGAEKVGSFGDASAWSLQGQKTITGGEGGIMLTKSKELFERALLQGHYNKRAKSQIRESSHLYKYHLTGMGQKFRAHPLAIRLALNQFHKLESILTQRQLFADRFVEGIKHIPFLKPLLPKNDISPSNYALIVKFEKSANLQITREAFVDTLIKEGLCEVDIPGSTGLLHTQPLFTDPHEVLPRLYDAPLGRQVGFSKAESFHSCIIKFPVWSFKSDQSIVDGYVEGINKVGQYIMSHGSLE
jgi:perosamine synthetase